MKLGRALIVLLAMIVAIACIVVSTIVYFPVSRRSVAYAEYGYAEPALNIGDFLVLQNEVSGATSLLNMKRETS
jgi:hypothetical protein